MFRRCRGFAFLLLLRAAQTLFVNPRAIFILMLIRISKDCADGFAITAKVCLKIKCARLKIFCLISSGSGLDSSVAPVTRIVHSFRLRSRASCNYGVGTGQRSLMPFKREAVRIKARASSSFCGMAEDSVVIYGLVVMAALLKKTGI